MEPRRTLPPQGNRRAGPGLDPIRRHPDRIRNAGDRKRACAYPLRWQHDPARRRTGQRQEPDPRRRRPARRPSPLEQCGCLSASTSRGRLGPAIHLFKVARWTEALPPASVGRQDCLHPGRPCANGRTRRLQGRAERRGRRQRFCMGAARPVRSLPPWAAAPTQPAAPEADNGSPGAGKQRPRSECRHGCAGHWRQWSCPGQGTGCGRQ